MVRKRCVVDCSAGGAGLSNLKTRRCYEGVDRSGCIQSRLAGRILGIKRANNETEQFDGWDTVQYVVLHVRYECVVRSVRAYLKGSGRRGRRVRYAITRME